MVSLLIYSIVGYHDDTLASLVYQICCEMGQAEGNDEWKNMVCDHVKNLLLQCATPEAVCRLNNSKLRQEADELHRQYMEVQQHSSLASYLTQQLRSGTPGGDGHHREIIHQVTTHSRLLVKEDRMALAGELGLSPQCVQGLFLQKFQTEQQFSAEIRDFFGSRQEREGLLLVQCEDGHQNNQLIACASYCIQDERTQAKQEASQKGIQLYPAHVVFVIQLSRMGKGFTGFQGGTSRSAHIDDLRPSQPNRPEISTLRGQGVHSLLQQDLAAMNIQTGYEPAEALMEIGMEVDNRMEDADEMAVADIQEETMDTSAPPVLRAVEVEPCVQTREQNRGQMAAASDAAQGSNRVAALPPIDCTKLLQESLHGAALRIGDSEDRWHRTTERITLLQQYLQPGIGQGPLNFLSAIKQRVTALTGEWEERSGSRDGWLHNEAIAVAKVHESGTFRRSIWQHLVSIVTPLLAEILAFCDYNDNLSLLNMFPQGHWQHQLWLAILSDPTLSPLHYADFLSPKNQVLREKALVKMLGSGERHFTARLSFSWLLKNHLDLAHTTARELKANTEQSSVHEIFCSQIHESPWGRLLNQIIPPGASQEFMEAYMMDYVCMVYTAKSNVELECVCQALLFTSQVMMRESGQRSTLIVSLVGLHMAHAKIQGRLLHFSRLMEVYPDLVDPNNLPRLSNQDGEMTLDAMSVHVIIDSFQPTNDECKEKRSQHIWLRKVQSARPVIETVIQTILHGSAEQYGPATKKIAENAKQMWDKMSVQRLFIENVCPANADVDEKIAQQGTMLWMGMRNVSSMKNIDGLDHLEKILILLNKSASKLHFKYGFEDCPICMMTIQEPVELPCHHVCCEKCIRRLFHDLNKHCPTCRTAVPKDYKPIVTKENKAALDKFHSFRQRCNAFFMDVVSQLCFADGTAPSHKVITKLLSYVTRKPESDKASDWQTKRLTAFKGDCIDRTPVIRSVLLQLLLQASVGEVQAYMSQYLDQAQRVLLNSPAHDVLEVCTLFINCIELKEYWSNVNSPAHDVLEVCTLFINCIEVRWSQYLYQAQRVLVNSPAHDVLEVCTLFINCIEVRLSQYLDQAQRLLVNSPAHDVLEVCTLFINCIEVRLNQYLDQALRRLVNSPAHDVLEVCTLFINCIAVRLSQYLDQAQRVLVNSPAHDVLEVCTLFINCIEVKLNQYLYQAQRVLVNSPAHDVLEVCTLFINCIEIRLSQYLYQAQRVLVNSPAYDVLEVCTLFINCIEVRLSQYLDQALRVLVNSPAHDVLEVCTLFINCIEVRLNQYLDQAQRVLVNSPAYDVLEVCTLFINCIEVRLNQYLDQALRRLVNSPAHDVLEVCTLFINCIAVRLSQYLDQAQRVLVNSPAHDVLEVCTLFINCIEVKLNQYLYQAQRVLVNSPAHDVLEVCTLFINCIEDALYRKASSQVNPTLGLLNSATLEFRESAAWLRHRAADEGVTVQYLQAIAGARFGMVVTAQFLHEVYCGGNRQHDREIERQIKNLFQEAKSFCNEESNHQAHLFLIRQLCKCYGTNTMDMLSQHAQLRWVKPRELKTGTTQVPDRFVVCGGVYRDIREALAQFVMTDQFGGVTAAVRDCQKPRNQQEAALLLALYREVTLSHCAQGDQEEVPQQMKQELQTYIQGSPSVHCKDFANCLVTNQLGHLLSADPGQTTIHQTLSALVVHTFTVLSCAPKHHLLGPLQNLLAAPAQLQKSFLPTMPEDYRMEAREAIAARDNVQWYGMYGSLLIFDQLKLH
ncbi:E3 ubiquitin-protein ligase RNF213-like [Amphiura filiformis]|uniref:E3 ubiquitin-protein ligase RNF213-like n=1 Tax=Amphiura filiformis TaxID=82378 RepID=UPI003B20F570